MYLMLISRGLGNGFAADDDFFAAAIVGCSVRGGLFLRNKPECDAA